jgi:hypothetical protein
LQRTARVIDDYAAAAGDARQWADTTNHEQAGDPAKAAAAIIAAATSTKRPLRLALGADCVARVEAKLAHVAADLTAWRDLSLSTEHRAAPAANIAFLPR